MQVGLDIVISAICKSQLQFGSDDSIECQTPSEQTKFKFPTCIKPFLRGEERETTNPKSYTTTHSYTISTTAFISREDGLSQDGNISFTS